MSSEHNQPYNRARFALARVRTLLTHAGSTLYDLVRPHASPQAEVLIAASRAVSAVPDIGQLMAIVLDQLDLVVPATSSAIHLIEGDQQRLVAARRLPTAGTPVGTSWPRHTFPLTEAIAGNRRALLLQNVLLDARWRWLENMGYIRAWLGLPLLAHDELIGFLMLDRRDAYSFRATEVKTAQAFADQLALALRMAHLLADARRHAAELDLRDQVRMAIAGAPLTLESLAQCVTRSLVNTIGYSAADCWELRGARLVMLSSSDPRVGRHEITLEQGVCATVARSGQPQLIADVRQFGDYVSFEELMRPYNDGQLQAPLAITVSEMCVPVSDGDRVRMVLNVEHHERLHQRDLDLLIDIGAQLNLALQHVRLVAEVQRVQTELSQAARMVSIGTLAAGVAHEFNNMLAALSGYAQLGLSGSAEEQVEALQVVEQVARRGKQITSGLLAFADTVPLRRSIVTLNELADQALLRVEQDLPERGIVLQRNYSAAIQIQVDPPQMVQAIINLLTNARDAMHEGGVLTVSSGTSDGGAYLSVGDTGLGIPSAVRPHLFEPFVTTKGVLGGGSQGGAGLGLAVCHGIVQRHGGSIDVLSEPGQGSIFTVRLPLVAEQQNGSESLVLPVAGRAALRVLVVEDDGVVQALLRAMLSRSGYQVALAADAESASTRLRQGTFDVMLCDLELPGMDGVQMVEQVRAAGNQIPVVLMTGRVDAAAQARLQSAEVASVLHKPFQMQEVLSALQLATTGKERWG